MTKLFFSFTKAFHSFHFLNARIGLVLFVLAWLVLVRIGKNWFGLAWFHFVWFNFVTLNWVRLCSFWLGLVWFGLLLVRFGLVWCILVRIGLMR